MTTRRKFIAAIPAGAVALALARTATAAAAKLEESDPAAVALGYKHDVSQVDAKKFPTFKPDHHCGNCALYQGKATDEWAPCGAFGGKLVANKGWCAAWAKKAG
jgi:hypothetical protein